MANNPTKTELKACRYWTADASVTAACSLKAESGAIAKVLSVHGTAVLTGKEVLNGEVTFDGVLTCRMTYIDGEGVRKVLTGTVDFHDSLAIGVTAGDSVLVRAAVSDIAAAKVETDGVTLKAVIGITAYATTEVSVEAITDAGDGLYGKTQNVTLMQCAGIGETDFSVSCEKEADVEGELLTLDAEAGISNLSPRVDGVVVEGTIVLNALYKGADGQLKNQCFSTAFCEEVPIAGINADASIQGSVQVKSVETSVTRADGVPTAISASVAVSAMCLACMPLSASVVTDVFCPGKSIGCKTERLEYESMGGARVTKNVEGTAELSEGMPALDAVLGVTAVRIGVANVYPFENRTKIEGVMSGSVLYYNKEYGTTNSVAVEIPYSVTVDCDGHPGSGTALVTGVDAKSYREGKIDLAAEVRFNLTESEHHEIEVVTGLEESDLETTEEAGITVYLAEPGLELWDIAKGLNVAPETVVNGNPNLAFPTVGGEKVVLYRRLSI